MNPISLFSLQRHEGAYETWGLRSRLLLNGALTPLSLLGYVVLHQFETPQGYLLVTDYECPYEEVTNFTLISKDLRLLSWRFLGAPYGSFLLKELRWLSPVSFQVLFEGGDRWRITIRPWGIPYLWPRLNLTRIVYTASTPDADTPTE